MAKENAHYEMNAVSSEVFYRLKLKFVSLKKIKKNSYRELGSKRNGLRIRSGGERDREREQGQCFDFLSRRNRFR